jgi:alkylated DNA repair dioxygenase AlkB
MMQELALGGFLNYDASFLSKEEADKLLEFLRANVSWEQKFYTDWKTGRKFPQPRLTAWYADDPNMAYSYSGITQIVQSWTPELLQVKEKAEAISGAQYNSVLLNFYRDGRDSVGLHADDERELGDNPNIASVSLGTTRLFRLRSNNDASNIVEYQLSHGSLLVMSGTTQRHWKHEVPKDHNIHTSRINLTFRKFYAP